MAQQHEPKGSPQGQRHQPASGGVEQATPTAGDVSGKVREFAAGAADTAQHLAQTARDKAEAGTAALGTGMRNLADALRQNVPHEGVVGNAATRVAETLERGGNYLEQEGMGALVEDLGTIIRRNPLPAVLVSVGVGFLVGQLCRSER